MLALSLEEFFRKKGKEKLSLGGGDRKSEEYKEKSPLPNLANPIEPIDTREEIAKLAGVSHGTLDKVREVLEKATSEQRATLDRDDASSVSAQVPLRLGERFKTVGCAFVDKYTPKLQEFYTVASSVSAQVASDDSTRIVISFVTFYKMFLNETSFVNACASETSRT